MNGLRKKTRPVKIGKVVVGGGAPVVVQSMTSTPTTDINSTIDQIQKLVEAGCEVVRISVPTSQDLESFKIIRQELPDVPLVADIHFNYRLAIKSADIGADKVRINPGNIGGKERVKEVIKACKANGIPIRIGVNAGSLETDLIDKYGGVFPESLVESSLRWIDFFEKEHFEDIIISVKSAYVPQMIKAYRLLSEKTDYPLHLGVTEAGPPPTGVIKSAIGIGTLLADGIGDTIRVSLTADPLEEVKIAWEILQSLELRSKGPMLISCPTCARVRVDLFSIVKDIQQALERETIPIKVAVMGCEVNGPGEAREADIGVAAAPGIGIIFKKGKIVRKVKEEEIVQALMDEIHKMANELVK